MFTCLTRDDDKYRNGKETAPHTYLSENSVHPGDIHYFSNERDIKDLTDKFDLLSLKRKEHTWMNDGIERFSSYWMSVRHSTVRRMI